jgi:hypothetical protein
VVPLDANPLDDIRNTRKILGWSSAKRIIAARPDTILQQVEKLAAQE